VDRWCIPAESSVIVRPIEPAARVEIWATHSNLAPLPLLGRRLLAALKVVHAHASDFVARTEPGAIARRPPPRPIARKPLSGAAWRGNGQPVTRVRRRVYDGWPARHASAFWQSRRSDRMSKGQRKIGLAVAQMGPVHLADTRRAVVARLVEMLREAHGRGAELVVFPELALTTFFPRYWMSDAEAQARFFEAQMPNPEVQPL